MAEADRRPTGIATPGNLARIRDSPNRSPDIRRHNTHSVLLVLLSTRPTRPRSPNVPLTVSLVAHHLFSTSQSRPLSHTLLGRRPRFSPTISMVDKHTRKSKHGTILFEPVIVYRIHP